MTRQELDTYKVCLQNLGLKLKKFLLNSFDEFPKLAIANEIPSQIPNFLYIISQEHANYSK